MSHTLDTVRRIVGRRHKISRDEMAAILQALHQQGLDLRNPYVHRTLTAADPWWAWVDQCRGITCISVDARGSLRDGYVRYDEPGRMHPMQHAEVTFVPGDLADSTIDYLRRHADRVLLVEFAREPAREPAPREEAETRGCDNGHYWQTTDDQRDERGYARCPTCGEYWV